LPNISLKTAKSTCLDLIAYNLGKRKT